MSGTARTRSYATATACSAPTSLITGAMSKWETLGITSTSLPSGVKRSGRTHRRATLRRRRTSGGIGMTSTATTKPPPRSSNRSAGVAQPGKRAATPHDRAVPTDARNHRAGCQCKMTNQMTKTNDLAGAIIMERTFDAPIGRVWTALTDVNEIRQWYFDLRDFKPEIGYEFEFAVEHEGNTYHHLCKVTEVIPEKKIAYTWRYKGEPGDSLVTFELFPEGNKTRLKLTHTGIETFPKTPAYARKNFEAGWTAIVGSELKQFLEKSQGKRMMEKTG